MNGYKRFHDLTIDLGPNPSRVVALVGPNGCGKSSVLDALIYHTRHHYSFGNQAISTDTYHSDSQTGRNYTNIEINFTTGSFRDAFESRIAVGKPNTVFSFRSPYRYNSNVKIQSVSAVSDISENNYGASDAASLDQKMEENYRRLYSAFNRYRDEHDLRPSEAKAKIIGDLNNSIKRCLDLEIYSLGNVEGNQGTLYFRKSNQIAEFEFNVLSSGEKEVVDILLDLYLRKEDYEDSVFLIDEPELHINTSIQGKLLEEIDRLVGPKCQIWIATHSIGFLRALQGQMKDRCQIIHFKDNYNLANEAKTLSPVQIGPGTWREIFEVALDDLAQLVSPAVIIYCEGRAEAGPNRREQGLDARVFNTIFAATRPEACFTSSGGNTEPDQRSAIAITVLGKVFPKVDILVLKDRDMASGKPTNENDRQIYLRTNPHNHRVLKRWELENYLFDRDVLSAFCEAEGLHFDGDAYDAFVTNIYDQNLKDETQRIKNFCGVVGSISSDSFKIELAKYFSENMQVYQELKSCIFERT